MDLQTSGEIKKQEIRSFGKKVIDAAPLRKLEVSNLLFNATILAHLPFPDPLFFDKLVSDIYENIHCNPHYLKKYLILEYPLYFFRAIFAEEENKKWDSIGIALAPGNRLNAYAKKFESGLKAIVFSESLFSFVWDYYHLPLKVFKRNTKPGQASSEEDNLILKYEKRLAKRFNKGTYRGWPIMEILRTRITEDIQKWNVAFSLIFLIGHELGHLYLNHLSDNNLLQKSFFSCRHSSFEKYNPSQVQEHDADLFSSDIYIKTLETFTNNDKEFLKVLQVSGFSLFLKMAKVEGKKYWLSSKKITHPPSALRYMYICLRHRSKLEKFGFDLPFDTWQRNFDLRRLPDYDYLKDLGTEKLFQGSTS